MLEYSYCWLFSPALCLLLNLTPLTSCIIYVSSISLPQLFSITLYVNDILLSCPYKLTPDSSQIQSSIDLLSSWLHSKHLTINPSKTKDMVVSRISSNSPNFPILYLNGSPLERVYKLLQILGCYPELSAVLVSSY